MNRPERDISPSAQQLAALVSPAIIVNLEADREAIIGSFHKPLIRAAVSYAWDDAMRAVPRLTEDTLDGGLDRLAEMTLGEIAALVVGHAQFKGKSIHSSLRGYIR